MKREEIKNPIDYISYSSDVDKLRRMIFEDESNYGYTLKENNSTEIIEFLLKELKEYKDYYSKYSEVNEKLGRVNEEVYKYKYILNNINNQIKTLNSVNIIVESIKSNLENATQMSFYESNPDMEIPCEVEFINNNGESKVVSSCNPDLSAEEQLYNKKLYITKPYKIEVTTPTGEFHLEFDNEKDRDNKLKELKEELQIS